MQIDIPDSQSPLRAYVSRRWGTDDWIRAEAYVYIGDARVFTLDVLDYDPGDWTDEELSVKALTAFGKMLALKIGD